MCGVPVPFIFFCFGNGTLLIYWTSAATYKIFLIHGRHLPGLGSQVVFRPCAAAVNNHDTGQSHLWAVAYETSQPMVDINRAVSKVVFRPRPTWTIMRSGNPVYEVLYEFRLHCHLLGNLSIFYNNGFRSRETVNIKLYQY